MAVILSLKKKKVCMLCAGKTVSYKELEILRKYINEKGKMRSQDVLLETCACHQRVIAREIKRARAIAYLPYTK